MKRIILFAVLLLSCAVPVMAADVTQGDPDKLNVRVKTSTVSIPVDFTVDTGAYTAGDVLAATQPIPDVCRENGSGVVLQNMTCIDTDEQAIAMTAYVFRSEISLGAENSAPSMTDSDSAQVLGGGIDLDATYKDLGDLKTVSAVNLGRAYQCGPNTKNLYMALTTAGTPTYASGRVRCWTHWLQD